MLMTSVANSSEMEMSVMTRVRKMPAIVKDVFIRASKCVACHKVNNPLRSTSTVHLFVLDEQIL